MLSKFINSIEFMTTKRYPNLIFLCGGGSEDSFREKLFKHLENQGHSVIKPEQAMNWQNSQEFDNDLLELEKYYAALVKIIPLISESPGAMAELGSFVSDENIKNKLMVIIEERYYQQNSFIKIGPIRNLESFFEEHYSNYSPVCVLSNFPEIDNASINSYNLKLAEEAIKNFPSPKAINLNLEQKYFQILLLLDTVNILVVSEKEELKRNYKKHFSKDINVGTSIDEMLLVLKQLKLVIEKHRADKVFYLPSNDDFLLNYNYKPNMTNNVISIRRENLNRIYKDKNIHKINILNELSDTLNWIKPKNNLSEHEINKTLSIAPMLYKVYNIKKKKGGKREIAQPTSKLKILQRNKISEILEDFSVHPSSTAYIKNENGILKNAMVHKNSNYFLKLDFVNFFNSIKAKNFNLFLDKYNKTDEEKVELLKLFFMFNKKSGKLKTITVYNFFNSLGNDCKEILNIMTNLFTDEFQLSVGAPSSPFISNCIMCEFDEIISKWCVENGLLYTRYADDLTFSSEEKIDFNEVIKKVSSVLEGVDYLDIKLNDKKTKKISLKKRVTVTGLNITSEHKISIGRKQKRKIRAMVHHFENKNLSFEDAMYLKGWLSYIKVVESRYLDTLRVKYSKTIDKILTCNIRKAA